jgi:hypothetical protein
VGEAARVMGPVMVSVARRQRGDMRIVMVERY